ncbi:MAG: hydrogenase maturation nickel metallochaperone HypA [Legionellales bacterium RIFCSPHIGHO2_12_FULL_42_9]|nr:MAG: hydrogenase maturation nickel metallochaperone HypA [Legionellales bacterium RIFCSPHIGHO2_12_FULL_42_9]
MHELSLCRTILEIITEHTSKKTCNCVKKIVLEIGELAAVDEAALRFGFEVICKKTIAECAILEILVVEARAICDACQKTVKLKQYYDACENCGHFSLSVIQGDELRIKFIEVE